MLPGAALLTCLSCKRACCEFGSSVLPWRSIRAHVLLAFPLCAGTSAVAFLAFPSSSQGRLAGLAPAPWLVSDQPQKERRLNRAEGQQKANLEKDLHQLVERVHVDLFPGCRSGVSCCVGVN